MSAPQAEARLAARAIGVGAALAAALLWGGTLALMRAGVAGPAGMTPVDLALLRFLPAALVFIAARPRLPRFLPGLVLVAGGGAPFVLVVALGVSVAPAAEAGVLLPGAFPLWVALLGRLSDGTRIGTARAAGLTLIAAALAAIAWPSLHADGGPGALLLIGAAGLSACYTLALRRAGMTPLAAATFVGAVSVVLLLPVQILCGCSTLGTQSPGTIATQLLLQGGVAGLAGPMLFATAIVRLGAARAAAFGGLTPGAAALFGMLLLDERPGRTVVVSLSIAGLGVALANLSTAQRSRSPTAGITAFRGVATVARS